MNDENSSYTQMSEDTLIAFKLVLRDYLMDVGEWVETVNKRLERSGFSDIQQISPINIVNSPKFEISQNILNIVNIENTKVLNIMHNNTIQPSINTLIEHI